MSSTPENEYKWIKRKNVQLYEDIECESVNGKRKYLFDFLIEDSDNGDSIGVDVKDWGRVIGVNVVMQFWRKIRNSGLFDVNGYNYHDYNWNDNCGVHKIKNNKNPGVELLWP